MTHQCPAEMVDLAQAMADKVRPVIRRHFRTRIVIDAKADASPVMCGAFDCAPPARAVLELAALPERGKVRGAFTPAGVQRQVTPPLNSRRQRRTSHPLACP